MEYILFLRFHCMRYICSGPEVIQFFPYSTQLSMKFQLLINFNSIVPSEIQWTSFFFLKMSLMISFQTEILHMHIIYHRLIYHCMFEHLRVENKSGISCKIK